MRPLSGLLKGVLLSALLGAVVISATSCNKKYLIRDIDPGSPGRVRSTGPEGQDILQLADQMVRSIEADGVLRNRPDRPIIVVDRMANNTRFDFNTEVFTNMLRSELRKQAKGKYEFVSRDINALAAAEREAKRSGAVDYNPSLRVGAPSGADIVLVGSANSLSTVSTMGRGDTIVYEFRLVDLETQLDLWMDTFVTRREGKDDVLYR
jgi:PBP1b-binding outer membrane lipoprotein LpoB